MCEGHLDSQMNATQFHVEEKTYDFYWLTFSIVVIGKQTVLSAIKVASFFMEIPMALDANPHDDDIIFPIKRVFARKK